MKVTLVAGARPNFMKIAPIIEAIRQAGAAGQPIEYRLVHTGQHYDKNMSESFFTELGIPEPDANLECGGGTQAEQAANIMVRFEQELFANPTDLVLVVGDVTSTMSCSIAAKKLNIDVAHVEAGIRSGDMTMPEEVNRIVTDSITDLFFTTSEVANTNLRRSGVGEERIHFVGNTMIDTLLKQRPRFVQPAFWSDLGLQPQQYFVLTLHRPANVDDAEGLRTLIDTITQTSRNLPIIFPVHPRTARNLKQFNISAPNLHLVEPMSYLQFNYLVERARAVITDSGGITEETTVMGVPCITLRNSTERPETVTVGTNELIGTDPAALPPYMERLFSNDWKQGGVPELWDGQTAGRIVDILLRTYSSKTQPATTN
ncbi:non-hydrolyzing UDP-N-acetylglucosamine 2-epimerase [Flaviaesturariibacter amylovorans]|uniref:UDP-N-acetylglucosamine 2-epimerase (Non-hydrolyzing) n=1 Tax=Flaviaesturariibacter amylovorans TaxID=1084520 RepID=A0ABP8GCB6_9BACT